MREKQMYIENLDEIKRKLDPEKVLDLLLQPGMKKKRSGKELRAPCPVHGGDGPENFSINLDTHAWCCHSNQCKGTNLVDLYSQSMNVPFPDAAVKLANQFGISIQYKDSKAADTGNKKYTPEKVLKCWEEATPQGEDTYFNRKGLTPPPIVRFGKNPSGYYSTLLPMRDIDEKMKIVISLSKGGKFNYNADDDTSGAFARLGELIPDGEFYIGEGIATVQTAWEATQREIPAISAGSWINLKPALDAIKTKYTRSKPIVLIDCDGGQGGLKAAKKIAAKYPEATFRKPSFESLPNPKKYPDEELKDFNDIISKCDCKLEEVERQLGIEFDISSVVIDDNSKMEAPSPGEENQSFYSRLGALIGDIKFAEQLKERSYDLFEQEHKKLFAEGGLITGYPEIDDQLYFSKGDFVVVQAMSNHGKSTFMLQMAYRFLSEEENRSKDPMCVFVTYESTPLRIEEKLINIIGHAHDEGIPLQYNRKHKEKYLYADRKDCRKTINTYNNLQNENRIHILKRTPLENFSKIIDLYKSEYPGRTIILFLDYLQIIESSVKTEGWEKIKEISYKLESLSIEKEIIVVSACQVNENRQTREGRDIYNAATTLIDLFNHSHASLKSNKELLKVYQEQEKGKNVCTFSVFKQKHGSSFVMNGYFWFDGYGFKERPIESESRTQPKQNKKDPFEELYPS